MCDCAEEQQRRAEKRLEQSASQGRIPSRSASSVRQGGGRYAAERPGCRFFSCGLFAGGAAGAGGWLRYAGSALLLAFMAFMLRKHVNLSKLPKLPKVGDVFGGSKTGSKINYQCDYNK